MEDTKESIDWNTYLDKTKSLEKALSTLKKYRSVDTTLEGVMESCRLTMDITEEEWMLQRDIFLRIAKQNETVVVPRDTVITAAMAIEVWHAFFENNDVSIAALGIRHDLTSVTTISEEGNSCIHHSFKHVAENDANDIGFQHWMIALCRGDRCTEICYFAKFHHCRWYTSSSNPKLNCLVVTNDTSKTDVMFNTIKRTCPTRVGDMETNMTAQSFNIDRNLNDLLVIMEEVSDRYLGGKSDASANKNDALNYFKSRITNGIAITSSYFLDETNNNRLDVKYARSSCQGNYLMASNVRITDADAHLISRFMVLPAPETKEADTDEEISATHFKQHKDLHRVYYLIECMDKSGVVKVEMAGARSMIKDALDTMERNSGIQTSNTRKRNNVLEMARCICIASVVWHVMVSPKFNYLQYHPQSGKYIGLNPRVLVEGIFPLLVVTKSMVTRALVLLANQWESM